MQTSFILKSIQQKKNEIIDVMVKTNFTWDINWADIITSLDYKKTYKNNIQQYVIYFLRTLIERN